MAYSWNKTLETGNEKIDEQHKQLFEALNSIVEASNQGKGKDEIYKTVDFLTQYTIKHFLTEEKLQQEVSYSGYLEHKAYHDEFKKTVKELTQHLIDKGPTPEVVEKTVTTVGDWLIDHIRGHDLSMAVHIKKGNGE